MKNGPAWVKVVIADLIRDVERFRDEDGCVNFAALGRSEYKFRTALATRNFSESERARQAWDEATIAYNARLSNGRKGGRPRKDASLKIESASARPEGLTSTGPRQALTAITADYHNLPAGAVHQGSPTEAPAGASFHSNGAGGESAEAPNGGSPRGDGGFGIFPSVPDRAPKARKAVAQPKRPHGSAGNVMLTDAECQKLAAEYGDVSQLIEELSDYLLNHPGKYKSHYAALRSWARRRKAEGKNMDGTRATQGDRLAAHYDRMLAEAAEKDRLEAARKADAELRQAEALAEARAILNGGCEDDEY